MRIIFLVLIAASVWILGSCKNSTESTSGKPLPPDELSLELMLDHYPAVGDSAIMTAYLTVNENVLSYLDYYDSTSVILDTLQTAKLWFNLSSWDDSAFIFIEQPTSFTFDVEKGQNYSFSVPIKAFKEAECSYIGATATFSDSIYWNDPGRFDWSVNVRITVGVDTSYICQW
ncbi:MAG: hypothetical protein B6244_10825 [Candidatus Cloacimonetes bacterium 4572_55]|nr:MAG: hypothetical protein B6244_10825 [Candidatus Cloacimonetes bacterium 4572_55]